MHSSVTPSPSFRGAIPFGKWHTLTLLLLLVCRLASPAPCHALAIVGTPTLVRATNAPLAGVLQVITDTESRVSISLNDGSEIRSHNFLDYGTTHSLPLLGCKPNRTNAITVTVYDRQQNAVTSTQPVIFMTGALPANFPNIRLLQSTPEKMEPGYTLFMVDVFFGPNNSSQFYSVIVNADGEVVWYNVPPPGFDIRQLGNADLFVTSSTNFVEFDLLGQTVQTWNAPLLPLDPHDGVPTDHGTILYLNDALETVTNFPAGTGGNTTLPFASVLYQNVVEFSATNSAVLNTWSPINALDPRRITYLDGSASDGLPGSGVDTEHSNAVIEDPSDDSLIVSMRDQNAVIKFSRATGQLKWILGPHDGWGAQWQPYLLTPVGSPFAWQFAQHSPVLTPQGTLMLYDDGNYRASPPTAALSDANNFSRAVEYRINEQTMEVSQVWEYGSTNIGSWLYTGFMGNAEPEPLTGNVLVDFSAVSYVDGVPPSPLVPGAYMARLKEVTHDATPEVVFDLAVTKYDNTNTSAQSCTIYRAHRIPDLYAHPALPVTDLAVEFANGTANLRFSGDSSRTYVIEASTSLSDWQTVGEASEEDEATGEFSYQDVEFSPGSARFYRVVTE